MAATAAALGLPAGLNSSSFLPFATYSVAAAFAIAAASDLPSLRLAGTISRDSIFLASRNLDARVQLVQPLRW